jgi:hypothetical protein
MKKKKPKSYIPLHSSVATNLEKTLNFFGVPFFMWLVWTQRNKGRKANFIKLREKSLVLTPVTIVRGKWKKKNGLPLRATLDPGSRSRDQ